MAGWHRYLRSVCQVGNKIESRISAAPYSALTYHSPTKVVIHYQSLAADIPLLDPFWDCDWSSQTAFWLSNCIPLRSGAHERFRSWASFMWVFLVQNTYRQRMTWYLSPPLMPNLGDSAKTEKGVVSIPATVQAIKKDIRQSPKKVNLVAKLIRGMRVEDALLQLQVLVKRAAKTVYQVIHSARANATHNHGLDLDRLLVAEAFVGKGLFLKRISYHSKGRSGIKVRPHCRLTVVVRETTPEEEAKTAKLRVNNYKKLTRRERQLVPHQLIETMPHWSRKRKEVPLN